MFRMTVWALVAILLVTPLAVAQGPPDETPGGRPTETPSPTETPGPTTAPDGPRDAANDSRGDRPPAGPAASPGGPRATPAVHVEDAREGFGARPTDPGAQRPAFSYNASRGSLAVERAGAPGMEGAVDAAIEFRDEDHDGAYDLGEPVLQRHALRDLDMEIRAPSGHLREAIYHLPDNGTLTLRFHLDPEGRDEATKFDVMIDGFPFTDPDSRVAVGLRIASVAGLRLGSVGGVEALVAEGSGERPYLSWLPNVTADGEDAAVATSVHLAAAGDDGFVYWAYPQAASLVHDPLIGYVFIPVDRLGDAFVFTAALAVGGVLLLAGYEARRRFRA